MVFDTCALLWTTLAPAELSQKELMVANRDIENGTACVSSISFWEIGIKMKKKFLDIEMTLESYIKKIREFGGFEIIPVDEMIWMTNINLDWLHQDPADRTIIATAMMRGMPILTRDSIIRSFYPHQGWDVEK